MGRFTLIDSDDVVAIATAQTSLPSPPTVFGVVPDSWFDTGQGVLPDFDLAIWAAGTVDLTGAELVGMQLHDATVADLTVSAVDTTDNEFDITTHGRLTGDGPFYVNATGVLPLPFTATMEVWTIRASSGAVKLATSLDNALAGTAIDITTAGSGTITLVDIPGTTKEVRWHSYGAIGEATISLTSRLAYSVRCQHTPLTLAYGVVATLSSAVAVSAELHPIAERF